MQVDELKEQLSRKLKDYSGKKFWIVIDNQIIKFKETREPIHIWMNYNSATEDYELVTGRVQKKNGEIKTLLDESAYDKILEIGNNFTYGGIDFNTSNVGKYRITLDTHAYIIFIRTFVMDDLLDLLGRRFTSDRIVLTLADGERKELNMLQRNNLSTSVADLLGRRYTELAYSYLWRKKLRNSGIFSNVKNSIYLCRGSFIPALLIHPEIINPIVSIEQVKGAYERTDIYSTILENSNKKLQIGDISITFLTRMQVCKAFGLKYFVPFNAKLYYYWLMYNILPNSSFSSLHNIAVLAPRHAASPDKPLILNSDHKLFPKENNEDAIRELTKLGYNAVTSLWEEIYYCRYDRLDTYKIYQILTGRFEGN